jgi:hypothetical protein
LNLLASPAAALDIHVDILGDPTPDGCTPGHCSLREAVTLANTIPGPDRIFLPATPSVPLQLTIPGASENANATGDLNVIDDLEIIGTGASTTRIVQSAADRVLQTNVDPTKRLTMRGLTIQGGQAVFGGALQSRFLTTIEDVDFIGNSATAEGGAIAYAGLNEPSITEPRLVLRRVRFVDNQTTLNGSGGGAIHATSQFYDAPFVHIEDCNFIDNESNSAGGAILLSGSINFWGGGVLIRRSAFSGNRTGGSGGAALHSTQSKFAIRIEDSLFDGNVAVGTTLLAGGALTLKNDTTSIFRSTFSANSGMLGGAIYSASSLELTDSYLHGNSADFGGGAIWGSRTLTVDRSTFANNSVASVDSSDPGGGAIGFAGMQAKVHRSTFHSNRAYRGGAISLSSGSLNLRGSTIVAPTIVVGGSLGTALRILDNEAGNGLQIVNTLISGTCTFPAADRQWVFAFNNIEAPGNSCRLTSAELNGFNQVSATNAQINLGPLADNGGPTPTRLPGTASIAINQGSSAHCMPSDQRYYTRADARCDIGAVEVGALPDVIFRNGFE